MSRPDPFVEHRSLLFSIAYRMLGSVADAEDLVQEAYLRWRRVDPSEVSSSKSYLASIITRLCIDHLRSARVRRETGAELPAPLADDAARSAEEAPLLSESLSTAFLVLLGSLSPSERAAFLLRVIFEYDYAEVARILDKSEAACRQLVRRSRRSIEVGKPRYRASRDEVERALESFSRCCASGDLGGLLEVLAPDAVVYADGGAARAAFGKVKAVRRPIRGARQAASFLIAAAAQAPAGSRTRLHELNASPALLSYVDGALVGVISVDVVEGRIRRLFIQSDPGKLAHLGELLST